MDVKETRGYLKFGQLDSDVHRTEDFDVEVKQKLLPLFLEARKDGSWRELSQKHSRSNRESQVSLRHIARVTKS